MSGPERDHPESVPLPGPGYPTPQAAIEQSEPEQLAYVPCVYGDGVDGEPDFLAVIDLDPDSDSYQVIVDRVEMPDVGDELIHCGWNAGSSSCDVEGLERRYLLVLGQQSSRIYVVDTDEQRSPRLVTYVEAAEFADYDLSVPNTVHSLPGGDILVSLLGTAAGDPPGGFLRLNDDWEVLERWDVPGGVELTFDFWYQPRQNVLVSTEGVAPAFCTRAFEFADVDDERFGRRLHVWDWQDRTVEQTIDLGSEGVLPAAVRFLHSPESTHAYVTAALSSNVFHLCRRDGEYRARKVVDIEAREHEDWATPMPGLTTDAVVSMDDRYLFVGNWLHGDVRMYDISDPVTPRFVDDVWAGGHFGPRHPVGYEDRPVVGGPQQLQLSLDGERLYWTTSLYSSWDERFFPEENERGSVMLKADVDPRRGTITLDQDFLVDFGDLDTGPARAHEIRWPGGDCTSDVWL